MKNVLKALTNWKIVVPVAGAIVTATVIAVLTSAKKSEFLEEDVEN